MKRAIPIGLALLGSSGLFLGWSGAALAQQQQQRQAAAGQLEEIVVTAERRQTTQLTTAISVDVLTDQDLATDGVKNVQDLQDATPNLTINQTNVFHSVNIRGIGNQAITPVIVPGVAVFRDGLFMSETINLGSALYDVGSVQVLRGPQGTFVGTSSTGGAVQINSARPNFDGLSGFVDGTVGDYGETKLTGAVNMPMTDTLASRVAFNVEQRDSYFHNDGSEFGPPPQKPFVSPGKVDAKDYRAMLLWQPNESFQALFKAESDRVNHDSVPMQPNPRTFVNRLGGISHSQYYAYDDPNHDPWTINYNSSDVQDIQDVQSYLADLTYTLGNGIQIRSLTGYTHNDVRYIFDNDYTSANAAHSTNDVGPNNNYFSEEVDLISPEGPVNWVVGGSWYYRKTPIHITSFSTNCGENPDNGAFTPCPDQYAAPSTFVFVQGNALQRTMGVFGQLNWQFTDTLELQVGARENWDANYNHREGGTNVAVGVPPGVAGAVQCPDFAVKDLPAGFPQGCFVSGANQDYYNSKPTWKVGLNWTPLDDQFFYGFWARGYKSGGVSAGREFKPEQVDDYELGWKAQLMNRQMQVQLGGFYMDYKDMQLETLVVSTALADNTVTNIGSSTIKGIEASLVGNVNQFSYQARLGYTNSKLGSIRLINTQLLPPEQSVGNQDLPQCAAGQTVNCFDYTPYYVDLSGSQNLYSPEFSVNLSADYSFNVGRGVLRPRVAYTYTDKQYTNLLQSSAYTEIPSHDIWNLSLNYDLDTWTVQAYCHSCADNTYISSISTNGRDVLYGAPRTLGVRIRKTF